MARGELTGRGVPSHVYWRMSSRSVNRAAYLWALLPVLVCCAHPLEKSRVAMRFQEIHGCPANHVYGEGDRWIAEGCGVRAHFTCVSKYDDYDLLLGSDTCVQEAEQSMSDGPVRSEALASAVNEQPSRVGGQLVTSVALDEGQLLVHAAPSRAPRTYTVTVRVPEIHAPTQCELKLLVDGHVLELSPVKRLAKPGFVLYQTVGNADHLQFGARSQRLVGKVCGKPFVATSLEQARFKAFSIRVLEERELAASPVPSPAHAPREVTAPATSAGSRSVPAPAASP